MLVLKPGSLSPLVLLFHGAFGKSQAWVSVAAASSFREGEWGLRCVGVRWGYEECADPEAQDLELSAVVLVSGKPVVPRGVLAPLRPAVVL